jgi:hypothetical protein
VSAVADKLREARALTESGWTQEAFARDAKGRVERCESDKATCFCVAGALMRTMGIVGFERGAEYVRKAIGRYRIDQWNDAPERTQAEVLAAFDKAIALVESEQ